MFAEVAAAAATALAGSVATDGWKWAKAAVTSLFTKAGTPQTAVESWLDATEHDLSGTSDDAVLGRVESRWSTRLEDLLDTHPELQAELTDLVERLGPAGSTSQGAVVQQATAHDQAQQAIQGHGTQSNTFNQPR